MDMIPKRQTRNPPTEYESSFNNKLYINGNIKKVYDKSFMEEKRLVQVLEKIFKQISLKTGIKKIGNNTVKEIVKTFQQLYFCNSFNPKQKRI